MTTRTCPAPTPWNLLTPGDQITWQGERDLVERHGVVAAVFQEWLQTTSGHAVLASDYVYRTATHKEATPVTETIDYAQKRREFALIPDDAKVRVVRRVNALIDAGARVPDAVAQVVTEDESGLLRSFADRDYRNWRARFGLPRPTRTDAQAPNRAEAAGRPAADGVQPAGTPDAPPPQPALPPPAESAEPPVEPAAPKIEYAKACRYAAAMMLALYPCEEDPAAIAATVCAEEDWRRFGLADPPAVSDVCEVYRSLYTPPVIEEKLPIGQAVDTDTQTPDELSLARRVESLLDRLTMALARHSAKAMESVRALESAVAALEQYPQLTEE